jgi:hypothetical protein
MSHSELQHPNLIVKCCLENPNKSKSETVEHFKLLEFKIPTIYRRIKRFEKQENLVPGKNVPFHRGHGKNKMS